MTARDALAPAPARQRFQVEGAVQGVGFRPFVYRLATELGLSGWVGNNTRGVIAEVEGDPDRVAAFGRRLSCDAPGVARVDRVSSSPLPVAGDRGFAIQESDAVGERRVSVLPDLATCPDCLAELFDPADRRYRYPFINCTYCGPRLSIIRALPYDRPLTSMAGFTLCAACEREYHDPTDRRFHAQPTACPDCGPQLALWSGDGSTLAVRDQALRDTADWLRRGAVVAVKGLGGFHLMVDARNEAAVERLRQLKDRPHKPLAVMFPDWAALRGHCEVTAADADVLGSPRLPITLLRRRSASDLAPGIAPGNPYLGAFLPYTPLHHLLLAELASPVVATSGNIGGEPICIDEHEALERLGRIADVFLVHDRPIVRQVDDAVVQVAAGRPMLLRPGRGYAPVSLPLPGPARSLLALGGQLKNAVAVTVGDRLVLGQHIGDLETAEAQTAFDRETASLEALYDANPDEVVCDRHPDYYSTRVALGMGLPVTRAQHHVAHAAAAVLEHRLSGPVLAVSWDGTGLGTDGGLWGGEFLRLGAGGWERAAHLYPMRLPGGETAVREPRRLAVAALHACGLPLPEGLRAAFGAEELSVLGQMLERGLNSPSTTSAGRLFDAVAALLGLCGRASFEGQAAMAVQFAAERASTGATGWDCGLSGGKPGVIDWRGALAALFAEQRAGVGVPELAARFHATLAGAIVGAAEALGERALVLTGGCFQNRLLLDMTRVKAQAAGFDVYWPQQVPPNDGGLAVGQAAYALQERSRSREGRPPCA